MIAATVPTQPVTITLANIESYAKVALVGVAKKQEGRPDFLVGKCWKLKGHPSQGSCTFVSTTPFKNGTRRTITCFGTLTITHTRTNHYRVTWDVKGCV